MIAALFLAAAARTLTFTADNVAADNVTHALAASGHIVAVSAPVTLRGELMTRDAEGVMHFHNPTFCTTCSNEVGNTHWNVSGEVIFKEHDYVILKDMWLHMFEVPIFWLPYMYYPLDVHCGFRWIPGYVGRWGAYLLTRYTYRLAGDPSHDENAWWLTGATRFDLRYRNGVALGEDLDWNLGDFGDGRFSFYYAWDEDVDTQSLYQRNWNSKVERDRYAAGLTHRLEPTERDMVRVNMSYYADSKFRGDFYQSTLLSWRKQYEGYPNSGVVWEHLENDFAFGAEVTGRLNDFYDMVGRLPEVYLDVNPQPVFGLPVNYESASRVGYMRRDPAETASGDKENPFAFTPGVWAAYETFRFDTYHRLTAPFRTFGDIMSVVPRLGFHGTVWNESGHENLTGWGEAENAGELHRAILEGGVTFAGRGTAWIDADWQHMVEPYFDMLAQEAWFGGSGDRPYVFDNLDASVVWEDQFAGRARNLPYSYYGVTPGVRNAWSSPDERGNLRQIVDFDVYAAVQFNHADWHGDSDAHKLADRGHPNYGGDDGALVPGFRLRWTPDDEVAMFARAEYDTDRGKVASADAGWKQKICNTFKYNVTYSLRDYRCWDFSSAPFNDEFTSSEDLNYASFHYVQVGFENQPLDWFAWGPYVRWDIRDGDLQSTGAWFDYLTDCLGFRLMVEYVNSFHRIDGYRYDHDVDVKFYIYLRAFGPESSSKLFK